MPLERFDFITPDGFEIATGAPLMSIVQEERILETINSTEQGFESDLTPYGENGYFIVRVDAVRPSALAPLNEVREQAESFWRLRQTDDRLQETVAAALTRAETGETLDAIAASIPGTRVEESTLRRDQTAGPFTEGFVRTAFRAREDEPFEARAGDQRTRAVAIVTAITPGASEPDSDMIEAGILDGDYVIIRRGDTANSGEIVVALVDNEEATLKRLRRKGGSIALEAANPAYETRIFGPDRVKVQGRLVGLIRRYH